MRKIIWAICAVVLVGAIALLIWMPTLQNTNTSPQSQTETESTPVPTANGYTIKEYNGGIAVFSDADGKPFRITDVDIRTLPEQDQEDLKNGIHVNGLEEVNRLMEDYCS